MDPGVANRRAWELRAGAKRNYVTIQSATESPDGTGQVIRSWATFLANYPVRVEVVTGGEVVRGKAVSAETQILFTGRFFVGVTTAMRVVYNSTNYGIVAAIDPYGDRRELRIEAKS